MKRILLLITIISIVMLSIEVKAANYELKELIPTNKETTIVTNNFSYKGIYFNNEDIKDTNLIFKGIKNLTEENIPISISVGLFDENKKNIGTINYCSTNDNKSFIKDKGLNSKEEISYAIKIDSKYLAPKKTIKDVKYIAILHDNINCRTNGSQDYIGKKVEQIGTSTSSEIDDNTQMLLTIVELLAAIIFLVFIYKFLFTNAFRNFDGEDVRQEYSYINKKLKEERKNNPKQPLKVTSSKPLKSEKVKMQERAAKEKNKEDSNLHKFYK